MNIPIAVVLAIFGYCKEIPTIEDECINEIIQCYTDDNFTAEECIEEYDFENF